jgi:parvulin-like peptidyl-prolyl isomerase
LILQEAERRGITVSEAEVDEYITEIFGYFPDGTPTPVPTSELIPTSTLSPQQLTMVPQIPTAVVTETAEIEPTSTEEVAAEPTEALPTPTVYTEEAFKNNYSDLVKSYKTVGISENQFRDTLRADILRTKMMDEITQDLPREEEQVWARHILVETEEEAQDVLARLEAGDDFAALATALSTDTGSGANGGDLGWFGPGQMVAPFEEAAFALEIGEISEPVQSDFGWHVIQKLGHETRPVDNAAFEQKKQTTFTEWLDQQRATADIEQDETWQEVYPETPSIPPQYLALIGQ